MSFLDRLFRKKQTTGPEEAVRELKRRVARTAPDPGWVKEFGWSEAHGFLTYQVAMSLEVPLLESGDCAGALAIMEYLEQGPYPLATSHARGAHAKGCALLGLGRNEEALKYFNDCIEHHPDEIPEAPLNRALALANLGRYEEALADCDRVSLLEGMAQKATSRRAFILEGQRR